MASPMKPSLIQTFRQRNESLRIQLESERSTFIPAWRDIADFVSPTRPRFFTSDANKGTRKNRKSMDSTAYHANRTLSAGMMSGITSPARPWFKIQTPDTDLNKFHSVKDWLYTTSSIISNTFIKSNLYNILPVIYKDLGSFATGAMFVDEDFESVMHFYQEPVGSYCISNNEKLKVDTFTREFTMTVRQIIMKFAYNRENNTVDWSKVSSKVKNLFDSNQLEAWVDVCHIVRPNEDYDPKKLDSRYKKYVSVYYEKGTYGKNTSIYLTDGDMDKNLSLKGYDYFPVLAPRWEVTGEDVYGTDSPAISAIGDIMQLQTGEKRSLQAIDKMVNPPMQAPTTLKTAKVSLIPGDVTYVDQREGMVGLRPIHEVQFRVDLLENKQQQVRQRIDEAFFKNLFLMMSNIQRSNITAREIEERHEEKLLALGPVLEQLNQDLLDPLIDIAFNMHVSQGRIPPPPPELEGMELKVEYVSVMAQAQKLVGLGGIDRFTQYVGNIANFDASVMDKVNADKMVDEYADITSVPPSILRSDEEVQAMRQQRAQAQAQAQQAQNMQAMASAGKDLSEANMEGDNGLTRLMQAANAGSPVRGL